MAKKFKRSKKDRLIAGLLGGIADYYDQDSTIVRIVWLILMGFTGFIPGILIYVLAIVLTKSS